MEKHGTANGKMLAVFANSAQVEPLMAEHAVSVVCFNSAQEIVVGGASIPIEEFAKTARVAGLTVAELPIPYAFHTPLMRPAQRPFAEVLAGEAVNAPTIAIYSTVSGKILPQDADIRALLVEQLCAPVRFTEAFGRASAEVDLWLEVGPGDTFGRLARACGAADVYSIDAGGKSLKPLFNALAAIYTAGGDFHPGALFKDRFTRPFQIDWHPIFFVNPCELAPAERHPASPQPAGRSTLIPQLKPLSTIPNMGEGRDVLAIVCALISAERGVPVTEIEASHPMKAKYDLGSNGARLLAIRTLKSCGLDLRTVPGAAEFRFGLCTVGDLAEFLRQALKSSPSTIATGSGNEGLHPWVETFEIALEEVAGSDETRCSTVFNGGAGRWEVLARNDDSLVRLLRTDSQSFSGSGTIVCFPENPTESDLHAMIDAARSALTQKHSTFIHVHYGKGAGGFVRSLKMEYPQLRTAILCVPNEDADSANWISVEIASFLSHAERPHIELHRLPDARRMEPRIRYRSLECSEPPESQPRSDDVFLVSGGAKGFVLQWILDIAKATKSRFALIGRSLPGMNHQVAENLRLLAERGVMFRYYSADVLTPLAVADVVAKATLELGTITGVIHAAAATNDTCTVSELTAEQLSETVRTKVDGLRNLLAAVESRRLRWLYALGSIIARTGLQGEAAYAVANEWLAYEVEGFKRRFPRCRCVTLELSALDSEGRATRADREFLEGLGVQFMVPPEVLPVLRRTFACRSLPARVIVSGRFGKPPTVRFPETSLPALRFAPTPQIHYPRVEFVAETELTFSNDPYLQDHALEGEHVFPAVIGLEAAAQMSAALCPGESISVFRDIQYRHPIVVSETAGLFSEDRFSLRIMGQRVSCDEIAFGFKQIGVRQLPGIPDFMGRCRFRSSGEQAAESDLRSLPNRLLSGSKIPVGHWYGQLFFHQGRFRRIHAYHSLRARHCLFELECPPHDLWFHRTISQDLLLGDPGARDAAIHGIQACIPHRRLLPAAVDEICIMDALVPRRYVEAHELAAGNDEFVYDIRIFDDEKRVVEIWHNLKLRDVGELNFAGPWPLPLLSVYLERRVSECLPHTQFRLEITPHQRHGQNHLVNGAIGPIVGYNADGKPIGANGHYVSRAHAVGLAAVVFDAPHEIACDLELVGDIIPDELRSMLPPTFVSLAENLASRLAEPFAVAATRAWTAWEALHQKLGTTCEEISFIRQVNQHWIVLRNGRYQVVVGQIPQHLIASPQNTTKHFSAKGDLVFALAVASTL
jgi:enediyne polyketide synthase